MFQFPGFAPANDGYHAFNVVGFPIRTSADHIVFANPRSLSQLITSFIASESQGIRHTLLITFLLKFYKLDIYLSVFSFNMSKNFFHLMWICGE